MALNRNRKSRKLGAENKKTWNWSLEYEWNNESQAGVKESRDTRKYII